MNWRRSRSRSRSRSSYSSGWSPWPEYVPVAERRAQAAAEVARMTKGGNKATPIQIEGRTIASTVWGKAWCAALESHADQDNRLPRGRSYVRTGCVVDLKAHERVVEALVSGSSLYRIRIEFTQLPPARWTSLKQACAGKIGSLVELLQGKVSTAVMAEVARSGEGLFPLRGEMTMRCSCPDGARMCKHLAAVLYGVGHRLDTQPELLFSLRGVDPTELISAPAIPRPPTSARVLTGDLSAIFGVDLDPEPSPASQAPPSSATPASRRRSPAYPPLPPSPALAIADAIQPAHKTPGASKPKASKPKASKPKAAEPKATKPKASKPKASKPKAAKPKAAEPKAAKPTAARPTAAKPKAAEPTATGPKAAKPKAAKPKAAKPKVAKVRATGSKAKPPKKARKAPELVWKF